MRFRNENPRFQDVLVRDLLVFHVTDKAILVVEKDTVEDSRVKGYSLQPFKKWLPRSQIRRATPLIQSLDPDDVVEVVIPRWLAEEKEMMFDEI